ncbi:hypothetical protein VB005_02522 [Metarhizium brunneum]
MSLTWIGGHFLPGFVVWKIWPIDYLQIGSVPPVGISWASKFVKLHEELATRLRIDVTIRGLYAKIRMGFGTSFSSYRIQSRNMASRKKI